MPDFVVTGTLTVAAIDSIKLAEVLAVWQDVPMLSNLQVDTEALTVACDYRHESEN